MWVDILAWFLAVQAAGLAALPLSLRVFRMLPDGGYALSKPLGLLAVAYLVWLPGMLGFLEYRRSTVLLVLLLLAASCWWVWGRSALVWLSRRRGLVAIEESLLVAVGLLALFVRSHNADLIGQEKFMDLAFFSGFLATTELPAEDTWLSGHSMPYYPFGYLLFGVPSRLAGLPAPFGYNLAMVLVATLTFLASASLAAGLVGLLRGAKGTPPGGVDWAFGLFGACAVMVFGNLVGPLEIVAALGHGSSAFWEAVGVKNLQAASPAVGWPPVDGGWWWRSSRVIATIQPDGITEFPYFSFLLGDLHPHYMALPILLLIIGLTVSLVLAGQPRSSLAVLLVSALALGAPLATNTWDVATFWTLYGLASLLVVWRTVDRRFSALVGRLVVALAPIPLGVALYLPYFVGYASQRLTPALVPDRTPPVSLMLIFGPFLLLALVLATRLLWTRDPVATCPQQRLVIGAGGAVVLGLALLGWWTAALAAALLALLVAAAAGQVASWRLSEARPDRGGALVVLGLIGLALMVIVGVEIVYVRDSFGTRMNTVFKFYYHVWLLLALASAPALALWLRDSSLTRPSPVARTFGAVILLLVLVSGITYPLSATWTKSNGFRGPATLDGAAFLSRSQPGDAAAIRWLAERGERAVVLEAVGNSYEEFARVSVFSGLPTVLGWAGHELQWRGPLSEYEQRRRDVERLYQRADREEARLILERYRVAYVFVGSLERRTYGPGVEERLARYLVPVFHEQGTTVFAVPQSEETM